MNKLRFRWLPVAPVAKRETTTVFADEAGVLRQQDEEGSVSAVGGNGGSQPVLVATKHLAAVDMLSLGDTAVEIIPVPDSGVLNMLSVVCVFNAGVTPYTDEGILTLEGYQYVNPPASLYTTTEPGEEDQVYFAPFPARLGPLSGVSLQNCEIYVDAGTNPENGDGTMDITVYYTLIELP